MTIDIFIELPADPEGTIRIARMRKNELESVNSTDFRGYRRAKAIAFAPAVMISHFRVPVSARSESEARRTALFAIEDELAQPVEDVTLSLGPKRPETMERDAYVVDCKQLRNWRSLLDEAGLGHAPIIAENSLRASNETVWDFGDHLLMLRGDKAVALDTAFGANAISSFIATAGFEHAPVVKADALATLAKLHLATPGVSIDNERIAGPVGVTAWRSAAALAVVGLSIWGVTLALDTSAHQEAARQAETLALQMFRTQFEDAPEPFDVHAEVRRTFQLTLSSGNNEFQTLASSLFHSISASETIRLSALSYKARDGAIEADLQFANAADEAAFRTRLEANGLKVDTAQVTDEENGVTGHFVLKSAT